MDLEVDPDAWVREWNTTEQNRAGVKWVEGETRSILDSDKVLNWGVANQWSLWASWSGQAGLYYERLRTTGAVIYFAEGLEI
jgi:hypothetical protein